MRGLAYAIAAIAAVGIMIAIATIPKDPADAPATATQVTATQATSASSAGTFATSGVLMLSVPEMHCEFACYPRVKETLEAAPSVEEVELAPQKEEGTIDNRQVIVKYDAGFDVTEALRRLAKEGFSETEVIQ